MTKSPTPFHLKIIDNLEIGFDSSNKPTFSFKTSVNRLKELVRSMDTHYTNYTSEAALETIHTAYICLSKIKA